MFDVYHITAVNVANLCMFANCSHVELYTVEMSGLRIIVLTFTLSIRVFVHVKYTYKMASRYDNVVSDVKAPHVWSVGVSGCL